MEAFSKKPSDTLIPCFVQEDTFPDKISPTKGRNTRSRKRTCQDMRPSRGHEPAQTHIISTQTFYTIFGENTSKLPDGY